MFVPSSFLPSLSTSLPLNLPPFLLIFLVVTVPEAPQSVTLTILSSTALMVEWEVPICDNGQRTGYRVSNTHVTFGLHSDKSYIHILHYWILIIYWTYM